MTSPSSQPFLYVRFGRTIADIHEDLLLSSTDTALHPASTEQSRSLPINALFQLRLKEANEYTSSTVRNKSISPFRRESEFSSADIPPTSGQTVRLRDLEVGKDPSLPSGVMIHTKRTKRAKHRVIS
ncbi:hypothetical protein CORC01_14481 [Colletotrichum orchidophilum]|uniref:Uncharacterized protein n=1 Tax=Colletotrichum orchidophilum TaxID=1209926 RepID=A0A1G4AMH2_9PEZI|nr:uncharacterized protein CORC01_14481 [Colletotrichum orchidophilum]OHE90222.1 hypothetical protein CORC01_14481 [Colletotrichum orchidophilum]